MRRCDVTEEQLQQFLDSRDDCSHSLLSSHVESCEQCEQRLQALANGGLDIASRLLLLSEKADTGDSLDSLHKSIMIPQTDRFEIRQEIAKGGMGVVVRARDRILRRDVALKIIKFGSARSSEAVSRFVQEARICGLLQHPGVVPVHDLGMLDGEQPFLAMKLIEGQTLSHLMRSGTSNTRLLEIFSQVCQTMAYVHSKDVIHRDLKPANIMVGEFGEVQVTDWGLAKVLGAKELPFVSSELNKPHFDFQTHGFSKPPSSTIKEDATADSDWQTQVGEIIGTVLYMPPEQALGQVEKLDKRSDVFALGAILCEILTGKPPSGDLPIDEVLKFAQQPQTESVYALLDGCREEGELVQLAKHCLSTDMQQRPEDARVLSDAMSNWKSTTQDRLRQAEIEVAKSTTLAATEKKRRRLTMAFAISLMALLATLTAASMYVNQQRQARLEQQQRKQQEILDSEKQINRFLNEASKKREAATKADSTDPDEWQAALHEVELAGNMLNEDTPAELRELVERFRKELSQKVRSASELAKVAQYEAEVFEKLETARARFFDRAAYEQSPEVGAEFVELYEQAFKRFGINRGDSVEEAKGKFDKASPALRERLVFGLHEWQLASRWMEVVGKEVEQDYFKWLGGLFKELDDNEGRKELRQAFLDNDVRRMQTLLNQRKQLGEVEFLLAVDTLEKSEFDKDRRAVLKRAVLAHPNSFELNGMLGDDYVNYTPVMLDTAMSHYLVCSAIRPDNIRSKINIGGIMIKQNRYVQAMEHFEELVKEAPDSANVRVNLGAMYMVNRRFRRAMKQLEKAVELDPNLIQAYVNLGDIYTLNRKPDKAKEAFDKALELDPENPDVYVSMANISINQRRFDEALDTLDKLFEFDPENKLGLSTLANIQMEQRDLEEAEKTMLRVVAISPQETGQYVNLSIIQRMQKDFDAAWATLEAARRVDPTDYRIVQSMGFHHRAKGNEAKAEEYFKEAREMQRRKNLPQDAGDE